jgi:hypothetical protein
VSPQEVCCSSDAVGDFDLVNDGANGVYVVGTMADQTLSVE